MVIQPADAGIGFELASGTLVAWPPGTTRVPRTLVYSPPPPSHNKHHDDSGQALYLYYAWDRDAMATWQDVNGKRVRMVQPLIALPYIPRIRKRHDLKALSFFTFFASFFSFVFHKITDSFCF